MEIQQLWCGERCSECSRINQELGAKSERKRIFLRLEASREAILAIYPTLSPEMAELGKIRIETYDAIIASL